jgi:hypothetical protein
MVKQLIKEAMDKNPIGLKEALQEELRNRIALALEAKMDHSDEDDYEDEEDDLDDYTVEELEESVEELKKHHVSDISHFDKYPDSDRALDHHYSKMTRLHRSAQSAAKKAGNHDLARAHSNAANSHHSARGTGSVHAFNSAIKSTKKTFATEDYTVEELEDFMESAEFDQLDEISKQKMGQYIKRAHADKDTQVKRADIFDQKGMDANKEADMYSAWAKANKARKKAGNRTAFIGKAVDRLAKD